MPKGTRVFTSLPFTVIHQRDMDGRSMYIEVIADSDREGDLEVIVEKDQGPFHLGKPRRCGHRRLRG